MRALVYSAGKPIELPSGTVLDGVAPSLPGEPNGFENRDDAVLSWDDTTRTLSIAPRSPATTYAIWSNGVRYVKTTASSLQIPDAEGRHLFYFDDDGVLQTVGSFVDNIIARWCFVALVYWDATNKQAVPAPFNETHGYQMPASVHAYLHAHLSAQWGGGLELSVTATGNGSLDSHCQFAASAGVLVDEDIKHSIAAKALTANCRVLYRSGTTWRMGAASSFPVLIGATGLAQWNDENGGNWQLAEAGSGDYVLAHVYAMPALDHQAGALNVVMGQATYSTLSAARLGAVTEIEQLNLFGMPDPEFRAIATLIVETKATFANTVKSRLVRTDTGADYIDWRQVDPLSVATTAKVLA
jgi:hypothetical protein